MKFFDQFKHRATDAEQMDSLSSDESMLIRTLDQFHQINMLFSRVRGLLRQTILKELKPGHAYHLLDLGAGACDIPVWLLQQARTKNIDLRITAIDADPRVVRYSRERYGQVQGLTIQEADALHLDELVPFDYIFANHFLHHLSTPQIETLFSQALQHATHGFVFSDLRRSPWSYLGFSIFAHIYRNSFSREDGLLSIRKGLRKEDLTIADSVQVRYALPGRIQWFHLKP